MINLTIITQNVWLFTLFRFSLLAGIYALWPAFIRWQARIHAWPIAKTAFWQQKRVLILGWLLVIELLLGQDLLFKALAFF